MMDKSTPLHHLREYEVMPPPYLYGDIWNEIEGSTHTNPNLLSAEETTYFAKLYDFEITPKSDLFSKIVDSLPATPIVTKINTSRPGKVISFINRYRAAAAVVVLLLSSWMIYKILPTNNQAPNPESPIAFVPTTNLDTSATPQNNFIAKKNKIRKPKKNRPLLSDSPIFFEIPPVEYEEEEVDFTTMLVNGQAFNVVDNDILVTFASYVYPNVPDFLMDKSETAIVIKIDKFSSLNLSVGAKKIMQLMYQVRNNGESTNKAKKTKRKINKWQKADQLKFDRTLEKNPFDPVDMADFIF